MHNTTWIFGYGSLMWRPGFAYAERISARLNGAHRSLCVYSHVHRGTPERPGLVLGLDKGGSCHGVAFNVAAADWDETIAYLRAREQVTSVYLEVARPLTLADGRKVRGVAYVVDRNHIQYAGKLALSEQARFVAQGYGQSGPNAEYVANTVSHLDELGIVDDGLHGVMKTLAAMR